MPRNQKIKDTFSKALAQALIARYKKIPSAAFLAKEFNLRAKDIYTIRQETARKWLGGLAVPELDKLLIIQAWLELDLNSINFYSSEESLIDKSEADNNVFLNKKIFLKKTNLLKNTLHTIMKEISDLEKKLSKNKLTLLSYV